MADISTYRFLMLIISLNLMLGIVSAIYANVDEFSLNDVDYQVSDLEQDHEDAKSYEGIWGTVRQLTDKITDSSIGNGIKWGLGILGILFDGIYPFSVSPSAFDNPTEKAFAWVFGFFRMALLTIGGLLAYDKFKNKKTN